MESSVDAISVPNRQSVIQINAKGPLRRKTWRRSGKQLCLKRRKSWLTPSLPSGLSAFESKGERREVLLRSRTRRSGKMKALEALSDPKWSWLVR